MPLLPTPQHSIQDFLPQPSPQPFKCHVPSPSDVPKPPGCTELKLCHLPAKDAKGNPIDLNVDNIASAKDLEDAAIAGVQTLTLVGNVLGITTGNTVALPTFVEATPTIVLDTSSSIPTGVVGSDNYLLATPDSWLLVPGTTNKYTPVYIFN